jgi:DNA damage-inducible protein 1
MDKRYSGIASGVGQGKILGKVLNAVMKMGNSFFPISVTVLESNSMECLFGLDTLRRYRCTIDLERNVLRLLDGATPEETPFLSEHEIPIREREVVLDPMDIAVTDPTTQTSAPAVGAGLDTGALSSSSSSSALPVIEQLMQLTASTREAVEGALLQAEGNADLAATLLFAAK